MLILIVIAAAVTLAAFVASYQKQYDSEQSHIHLVQLESIRVVGIASTLATPTTFATFQFTMASSDVNSIGVTDITINGYPLVYYWVEDLINQTGYRVTAGSQLVLTADEEATVAVNFTGPYPSFTSTAQLPAPDSYVTIQVSTFLGNQFTQSFVPPTAVAYVSVLTSYSGGEPVEIPVLDGTDSYQPGGNATIVSWVWTATYASNGTVVGSPTYPGPYSGQEVELPSGLAESALIDIVLEVTSSDGLLGSTTIQYLTPS